MLKNTKNRRLNLNGQSYIVAEAYMFEDDLRGCRPPMSRALLATPQISCGAGKLSTLVSLCSGSRSLSYRCA